MPVLKWDPATTLNHYIVNTTQIGEHKLCFTTLSVSLHSPRCNLWRHACGRTDSVGCVSPVPESEELLMEKMEELISKLYPDEYLKAVLALTETKTEG